jgi:hypothetical protein
MPAISNDDLTRMRYPYHRIKDATLNVFPILDLAASTGTVGSLVGLSYPLADVPVTGTSALWDVSGRGNYVRITDGSGNLVMETVWRKPANGTTTYLYASGFSRGDSGLAVEQAAALAAGQTVTNYRGRVPKSFLSRISGGVLYKRWDEAFSGVTPSPQGNMGRHVYARIDDNTGVATVTFSAANSFSWFGEAITYTWILQSGVGLVGGYTLNDATIEVNAIPGVYVIRCIIGDTTGGSDTSYRYLFVEGDDGVNSYTAFSNEHDVLAITSDVETLTGRSMTFEVKGNGISAKMVTGVPCLFTHTYEHSADGATWETLDNDYGTSNFFGFLRSFETISNDGNGVEIVRFTVVSGMLYAESLPFASQYLIENASPSEWWHVSPALSNAAFVPYYVMDLHSRFMNETSDYDFGDGDLYYKQRWNIDADNLADACRVAARPFLGNFGNVSDGSFYLRRNPQYETDANRNAVATVMTITDADIYPPVAYQRNEVMTARETEGGAFIYSGSGTDAKIKGVLYRKGLGAPMQGTQVVTMPDFIALDTTEAASRVGHYHQRLNAPTPTISFEMPGSYDAFQLALMEWWDLGVSTYDPLNRGLWSNRVLPTQIARNWSFENGSLTKTLSVTAEPETYGQPAINKTRQIWNGQGITPSQTSTINVFAATDPFTGGGSTGILVVSGQSITFAATGTWSYGPSLSTDANGIVTTFSDTILPNIRAVSLVGAVNGTWFYIGASNTVVMPDSGTLFLAINDRLGGFVDNSGSISVTITR